MKRIHIIYSVLFLLIFWLPLTGHAQDGTNVVVYLKNGKVVSGKIVEHSSETVVLETQDGVLIGLLIRDIKGVSKISQQSTLSGVSYYSQDNRKKAILSVNPLGLVGNGISWLGFEKGLGDHTSYQLRLNFLRLSQLEDDGGYFYEENEYGFGGGISFRGYLSNSRNYNGFYGAMSLDVIYTQWDWYEEYYNYYDGYSDIYSGGGSSFNLAASFQIGVSFALSNIRLDPSLVASYFIGQGDGDGYESGYVGIAFFPAVSLGIAF